MSVQINSIGNVLSMFAGAASKGPVQVSNVYDKELNTRVDLIDFEVSNLARIPSTLPFGLIAEIVNPGHINKARCRVRVGPSYFEQGGVVWPVVSQNVKNYNEWICLATVKTQVVAPTYDLVGTLSQTNLWEAKLDPIDERHSLLTAVYVVTAATLTASVWDDRMSQFISESKTLATSYAAAVTSVAAATVTHAWSDPIRCGWWVRTTNTFSTIIADYHTIVDHHWPAVLTGFTLDVWETQEGAVRDYPNLVWANEEYSGPCKALINRAWTVAAPTAVVPDALITSEVTFNCPYFSISTGPCLHGEIDVDVSSGTVDPEWKFTTVNIFSAATTHTAWPATLIIDFEVVPYKGGYFSQQITIYKPV